MNENEVTALLKKTRNYFDFIKSRLESESICIKPEEANLLTSIDSYLKIIQEDLDKCAELKSDVHRNVLQTCIAYLQRLDLIAKDYKLFFKGKTEF